MTYTYIIDNDYIKNNYGVDYKSNLENSSNIDIELKQNYKRLVNYIISHNVYLKSAGKSNEPSIMEYNKDATNPYDAFINQFVDDDGDEIEYNIERWKDVQALQAIYEQENGNLAMVLPEHLASEDTKQRNINRICPEALEILRNDLELLWRTEWMKG